MTKDARISILETVMEKQNKQLLDLNNASDHQFLQMKELSDWVQDNIGQLNSMVTGLSQEVAALQGSKSTLEARLQNLEMVMDQQQDQIRQLSDAGSSLTRDLTVVRLDHMALKDEHRALGDCLTAVDVLRPSQVCVRRRVHRGLGMLQEALDDEKVTLAVVRLAGHSCAVARLLLASSSFSNLRRGFMSLRARGALEAAALHESDAFSEKLLRAVRALDWDSFRSYEPRQEVLSRWLESTIVRKVFGSCVIENSPGDCTVMKFSDVFKMLSDLGVSLEQFVNKFVFSGWASRSSRSSSSFETAGNEILRRFRRTENDTTLGKNRMHFSDVYRLLELLGQTLERFEKHFEHLRDPELTDDHFEPFFGRFRALRSIGRGSRSVCYLAQDVKEKMQVAVKWPVETAEVAALKHLLSRPQGSLVTPRLVSTGERRDQMYIVTQALGSPLTKVFMALEGHSVGRRWRALSVLGRLMVRRLQSLHAAGLVHCDISPENILLGPAPPRGASFAPYLVDFGHAQRFPGEPLAAGTSSIEWSSIRSARGGEPVPEDDLQALGWVLLHGVFGELPWFKGLREAYRDWEESRFTRDQMVRQAKEAKEQFLRRGWAPFSQSKKQVPQGLDRFLRACHPESVAPPRASRDGGHGRPDYATLLRHLGGSPECNEYDAEEQDLRLFTKFVMPFVR